MRAGALALMMMIAVACRSRALDPASGSGMIAADGGGGFSGRGDRPPRVLPLGLACAAPSDCSSGFCEDGFCCNKACVGSCVSCAVPQAGLCKPSPVGAPARPGSCVIGADLPCGYDGTCDGTGACRLRVSGTLCSLGRCDESWIFDRKACDGLGSCQPVGDTSCDEGYGCDPVTVTCRTSCATDGGCPGREAGTDVGPPSGDARLD